MNDKKQAHCVPYHGVCYGCGACAYICPTRAIHMETDKFGFARAVVNDSCVRCGKCLTICPTLSTETDGKDSAKTEEPAMAWGAYCMDEPMRARCASGGVAARLSQEILEHNGIVVGAGFDSQWSVCHQVVRKASDLPRIASSKYVQSRMDMSIYQDMAVNLSQGKPTMFCGTPCQVAAVRRLFGYDEQLFLMDMICHGVPTPLMWSQYLREMPNSANRTITAVNFRDKSEGWKRFSMKITFDDGHVYRKPVGEDPYLVAYIKSAAYRETCYRCPFRVERYFGDITVGDLWGIDRWLPRLSDNRGTSVVICRTRQGKRLWERIRPDCASEPLDYMCYAKQNVSLNQAAVPQAPPRLVLEALRVCGFAFTYRVFLSEDVLARGIRKAYRVLSGS